MQVFLGLCLGLALFLFGIQTMSGALKKLTGGKPAKALENVTDRPVGGVIFGALITIAMQSSSASTVMLVGLVDAGVLRLSQTLPIILGANIGTTLTPWVLSVSGIESENLLIWLCKPTTLAPVLGVAGVFFMMLGKRERAKTVGAVLVGFCVLVTGMEQMCRAVAPLADRPEFCRLLLNFRDPTSGVLAGTVFTALIQSSSASVGILQALAGTGAVTWGMAIPVVMGQNIGTCVTAGLSSVGMSAGAKGVAVMHTLINLLGAVLLLPTYLLCHRIFGFSFHDLPIDAGGIALCHTLFNLLSTVILLPIGKTLVSLTRWMVRERVM